MAVRIEVLSLTLDVAQLALYYPATSPLADADDQSRTAMGTTLSGPELASLKDGTLIEKVIDLRITGMSRVRTKQNIERSWNANNAEAQRAYRATYRQVDLLNKSWDGVDWT